MKFIVVHCSSPEALRNSIIGLLISADIHRVEAILVTYSNREPDGEPNGEPNRRIAKEEPPDSLGHN